MSWIIKNYIKETRENETGAQVYPPGLRHPVAFIYPNVYHLGMSNLGMHILYQMINERGDSACERFFLPDKRLQQEHIKSKTPLLSLENQRPLADFDVIFVMLSFEMDYDNLLTVLDLGNIRLRAAERNQREPLVIIGGPCATFNPEPMAAVADAFVIGEGEETVQHVLDTIYREESKQERLAALAQVPGVYVPSLYTAQYDDEGEFTALLPQEGAPAKVARQWARDIDAYPHTSAIVTSGTEFEDMIFRGKQPSIRKIRSSTFIWWKSPEVADGTAASAWQAIASASRVRVSWKIFWRISPSVPSARKRWA